ncbi:DUF6843 domain-containing protein [Sporosarcina sp. CAU 1771]
MRIKNNSKSNMVRIFIFGVLAFVLLSGCMKKEETNAIYLIPEGQTGYALAVYNVKGAPPLTYENGFAVHNVNAEGYFATSKSDMNYGTLTDQYFWVDKAGNRTSIDELCVHAFGTGGWSQNDIDLVYTGIEITNDCSIDFAHSTENFNDQISQPILNQVIQDYYSR